MDEPRATPAPCLLQLRKQVNERWPGRNKASDGIMGDSSHQARKSDHNLGNAIDITHDPKSGCDAGKLAEAFRRQMSTTPSGRITYVIYGRRIASAKSRWTWRPYTGSNPHTSHVHISIKPEARNVTRAWKLD